MERATAACPMTSFVMEFTRVDDADDPHAFQFVRQQYIVQVTMRHNGQVRSSPAKTTVLDWPTLLPDLRALYTDERGGERVQRIGDHMRQVLGDAAFSVHEERIKQALRDRRAPVHLAIRCNAAELYLVPWELLTLEAEGQHLGELDGLVLSYAWPGVERISGPEPAAVTERVLLAWSVAGGRVAAAEHIDVLSEYAGIDRRSDVLAHVSTQRLDVALARARAQGRPVTALHILCHGQSHGAHVALAWHQQQVSGAELRRTLEPYKRDLRLVALSACHAGDHGEPGQHLGALIQSLHRMGIPWVVGSRYALGLRGSLAFTEAFYRSRAAHRSDVATAFAHARRHVSLEVPGVGWAGMQLYGLPPSAPIAMTTGHWARRAVLLVPCALLLGGLTGLAPMSRPWAPTTRPPAEPSTATHADLAAASQAGPPRRALEIAAPLPARAIARGGLWPIEVHASGAGYLWVFAVERKTSNLGPCASDPDACRSVGSTTPHLIDSTSLGAVPDQTYMLAVPTEKIPERGRLIVLGTRDQDYSLALRHLRSLRPERTFEGESVSRGLWGWASLDYQLQAHALPAEARADTLSVAEGPGASGRTRTASDGFERASTDRPSSPAEPSHRQSHARDPSTTGIRSPEGIGDTASPTRVLTDGVEDGPDGRERRAQPDHTSAVTEPLLPDLFDIDAENHILQRRN